MENIKTLRDLKKLNKMSFSTLRELSKKLDEIMIDNFNYKYQSFDTTNNSIMLTYHKIKITDTLISNYYTYIILSDDDNKIISVIENKTKTTQTIHI